MLNWSNLAKQDVTSHSVEFEKKLTSKSLKSFVGVVSQEGLIVFVLLAWPNQLGLVCRGEGHCWLPLESKSQTLAYTIKFQIMVKYSCRLAEVFQKGKSPEYISNVPSTQQLVRPPQSSQTQPCGYKHSRYYWAAKNTGCPWSDHLPLCPAQSEYALIPPYNIYNFNVAKSRKHWVNCCSENKRDRLILNLITHIATYRQEEVLQAHFPLK